ncbi:MAG TPA: helix-turn-helix domain-containing protein, partial [Chitinophagaceae bacterium]|nr:helix-turn-helix domain-containing protein [Chitinophagaceae bacterium]
IAISLFFTLFILVKNKRKRADSLLLLNNLAIIGLVLADAMFLRQLTPLVFFLLNIIPLYLFPLFLIFALETIQDTIHYKGRWIFLFIPALLSTAYSGLDIFIFHGYDQAQLDHLYNYPTLIYHLLFKGFPVVFIAAFIWLIRRLKNYTRKIQECFSYTEPIEVSWLISSTWIYLFITLLSLLGFIASQLQILPISSHFVCSVIGTLLFFAIFYISFNGIRQYTIAEYYGKDISSTIPPDEGGPSTRFPDKSPTAKYKTSSLSDIEQKVIFEKLIRLFEEEKVYAESKLQLSDVAEALHVSSHNLSQTINTATGKPFYDFVNGYRVRELQSLLEDPTKKEFTILSLGYESGFNSKASLNRVFRQHTGLSPSEYLMRNQQSADLSF